MTHDHLPDDNCSTSFKTTAFGNIYHDVSYLHIQFIYNALGIRFAIWKGLTYGIHVLEEENNMVQREGSSRHQAPSLIKDH